MGRALQEELGVQNIAGPVEGVLDGRRALIGWLTLLVFVLTFTPKPFAFGEP